MNISRYLKASPDLAAVTQHAERLLALQHLFAAMVPLAFAQHARVANFKQGVLVLHAANALIAAKLRQLIPSLTDEFSNRGWQVTSIQVAVQDRSSAPAPPSVGMPPLDAAARDELAAFARSASDPRVRRAVEHLLDLAAADQDTKSAGPDGEIGPEPSLKG